MSELKKTPTHYRLLSSFRAIGPYLREPQSEQGAYLFDCLAVCVSDKKSPELREFWGWWLELKQQENQQFEACYHIGLYDKNGDWQSKTLPKKILEEVKRTQVVFHQKLLESLTNEFQFTLNINAQSHDFA